MTKQIDYSISEKIAFVEFNKHILRAIQDGLLNDDIFDSKIYLTSQKALLVFVIVLEPLTYEEVKELALMTMNSILCIISNNTDLAKEADSIWEKYKNRFGQYMSFREDIIKRRFKNYGLEKTRLDIGNGIMVPINHNAFLEKYNTYYLVGFPNGFDDFILALKKIARNHQEPNDQNKLPKYEAGTMTGKENIENPAGSIKKHLLKIPTKATPEEILDFWFKLTGNNEKGEPYWESENQIEHFIYQNFDVFHGVDEIKVFNPNMSKSELNHVTWTFYHNYGMSKTKKQYEKLLMQNFTKFKNGKNVYSNIKDQSNEHLKKLFK